jgi:hypothetical protein
VSASQYLYTRWLMPSKKMIEVRRVQDGAHPEVVVREVNDNNQLGPAEWSHKLRFLLEHGKKVRHV